MTTSNHTRRHTSHPERAQMHVAIIMDGNGRWATARHLPRSAGHTAGVRTARNIVESAVRAGIGTLTLYAFSSDNWSRPRPEVVALMRLFRRSLLVESKRGFEYGAVIVVEAPLETRLDRLEARGVRRDDARRRIGLQASDEDRRKVATWVVDNAGDLGTWRSR